LKCQSGVASLKSAARGQAGPISLHWTAIALASTGMNAF
jgi:hypothetical protein